MKDADLLAQPGVMRALWWSRCRSCRRRIEVGDVVHLGDHDGHQRWLCRNCPGEKS